MPYLVLTTEDLVAEWLDDRNPPKSGDVVLTLGGIQSVKQILAGPVPSRLSIQSEEPQSPGVERRTTVRLPIRTRKIFVAQIVVNGEKRHCYLSVLDVSEGGMKVSTNFPFPTDQPVDARFLFHEPFHVKLKVAWQTTVEGSNILGIEFLDVTDETRAKLQRFIKRFA